MRPTILTVSTVVLVLAGVAVAQEAGAPGSSRHAALDPGELTWGDPPPALPPGARLAVLDGDPSKAGGVYTVRLRMPRGYTVPPHHHPTPEYLTVISGSLVVGTGDRMGPAAEETLGAGGFVGVPAGHHHYVRAAADTVLQVHGPGPFEITYVDPADDPRNVRTATGR